uniref:Uncharacterized protein n=1 Tax=Ditylenchus dipsaci TaxID=166011 RepID=A0A915EM03_9BILA
MPNTHTTIGTRHVFTVESTNLDTIYKHQPNHHPQYPACFSAPQQMNGCSTSSSSSLEHNPGNNTNMMPMISMGKSQSYPFNMMDAPSLLQHPQFLLLPTILMGCNRHINSSSYPTTQ